jgi:hypothetical protein
MEEVEMEDGVVVVVREVVVVSVVVVVVDVDIVEVVGDNVYHHGVLCIWIRR